MEYDGLQRLGRVQRSVRQLVVQHPSLADAMRASVLAVVEMIERFERHKGDLRVAMYNAAHRVLKSGRLRVPLPMNDRDRERVMFPWVCPIGLAAEIARHESQQLMPESWERRAAAQALKALDRHIKYQAADSATARRMATQNRSKIKAGTHVVIDGEVELYRPDDWEEWPHPLSKDPDQLRRFSDDEYHSIALYRLSGLHDVGASRPVVIDPADSQSLGGGSLIKFFAYGFRRPGKGGDLDAAEFPPELAEEMLGFVERRLRSGGPGTPTRPAPPAADHEEIGPALTANQVRVIKTMARFDPSRLLSADAIAEEFDARERLSARTIGPIVRKLIDLRFAERPDGTRSGARLPTPTTGGRRLPSR